MPKCECGHRKALHAVGGVCVVQRPKCWCERYREELPDGTVVAHIGDRPLGHVPVAGREMREFDFADVADMQQEMQQAREGQS